jgi:hypothetical protein
MGRRYVKFYYNLPLFNSINHIDEFFDPETIAFDTTIIAASDPTSGVSRDPCKPDFHWIIPST